MHYMPTVLIGIAIAVQLPGLSTATRPINSTAAEELPECVKHCSATTLPKYDCQLADDCFCDWSGVVANQLAECVLAKCPELSEALEGLKFQAVTCDYPMDRNRAAVSSSVAFTLYGLATFCFFARFLSRWPALQGAGLKWDDAIVLICYIPVVGLTVAVCKEVDYGSGRDSWTLRIENVVHFAKWFYIAVPLYIWATFTSKLSLIALYLRVWPSGPDQRYKIFRNLCWTVGCVLTATALACSLAMIFACHPFSNAWKYANTGNGTCINRVRAAYAYGGLNVAFDIVVIALPIPKLLRLDVTTRQKICLTSCFLVGFVATGCSIVRFTTIHNLLTARNITWDYNIVGLWSIIEVYCSMICCCMPAMVGLINRFLRHVGEGGLLSSRIITRLPSSSETVHPSVGEHDDTDLETLAYSSFHSTPKLPDDPEDIWAEPPPPLRRFAVKGGALVQQNAI